MNERTLPPFPSSPFIHHRFSYFLTFDRCGGRGGGIAKTNFTRRTPIRFSSPCYYVFFLPFSIPSVNPRFNPLFFGLNRVRVASKRRKNGSRSTTRNFHSASHRKKGVLKFFLSPRIELKFENASNSNVSHYNSILHNPIIRELINLIKITK